MSRVYYRGCLDRRPRIEDDAFGGGEHLPERAQAGGVAGAGGGRRAGVGGGGLGVADLVEEVGEELDAAAEVGAVAAEGAGAEVADKAELADPLQRHLRLRRPRRVCGGGRHSPEMGKEGGGGGGEEEGPLKWGAGRGL